MPLLCSYGFPPRPGHPPGLVDALVHMQQLSDADPPTFFHEPPHHAHSFEPEIQGVDVSGGLGARSVTGAGFVLQGVEDEIIQPLPEGVAVAFRKAGGAVERPAGQFEKFRVQRWVLVFLRVHLRRCHE